MLTEDIDAKLHFERRSADYAEHSKRQFAIMDKMPANVRELVHEYGFPIVNAFLSKGIAKPAIIRSLIIECWNGARQQNQHRFSLREREPYQSRTGERVASKLDWLLIQKGANITSRELLRFLRDNGFIMAPIEPTEIMIEASKAEVSGGNEPMTKTEKHRRRLRAALRAHTAKILP